MPNQKGPHQDLLIKTVLNMSSKIDRLDSRLDSIDKTLVKQEANLGEHMRRTELAEAAISYIRKEVEPVKKHVAYIEGALKGIGLVATAVSIVAGLVKIASLLSLI